MKPSYPASVMALLAGACVSLASVTLPPDFPEMVFEVSGDPSPGYYFFCPNIPTVGMDHSYLVAADSYGEVVFYQRWSGGFFDITVQDNGLLTYGVRYEEEEPFWVLMDSTYAAVDTFQVIGYYTDIHGMHIGSNGNVLLIGAEYRYVDMSELIPGGNPNALVIGLLIQEQNMDHEVVFEWTSFDHIPILDAAPYTNLTGPVVDYLHTNSIYDDSDGNILVSCLAMCECVKIDRGTGDLIWRLGGGYSKNSTFQLVGDPLGGFNAQHDFKPSGPDRYTVFDNGTYHSPVMSRALEYEIDLEDSTATLVWSYQIDNLYGSHLGSVMKLPDGRYVVGWGDVNDLDYLPDISEVEESGEVVVTGRFLPVGMESYKVAKCQWSGQASVPYLCTNLGEDSTSVVLTYNVFGENQYDHYRIYTSPNEPGNWSHYMTTPQRQVTIWDLPQGLVWFAVSAVDSLGVETGISNADSQYISWTGVQGDPQEWGLSIRPMCSPSIGYPTLVVETGGAGLLEVELYDLTGRLVAERRLEATARGVYTVRLDGAELPSGLYAAAVSNPLLGRKSTRVVVLPR